MHEIKTGIIGASKVAEEYVKIAKLRNNSLNLIGIVGRKSLKSKRLAAKYKIKYSSNNINELLKFNLDLIIVAVDIASTINVAKKLKDFKGFILFEKPLGKNYIETKKIVKFLYKNKLNCYVALNRRSYQNVEMVYKEIKKDNSKKFLSIYDQQDLKIVKKAGHKFKILQNWMYANSVHLIDLLVFMAQSKPVKITSEKINLQKGYLINSKVIFKNGNIGYYNAIWNRPGPWSLNISTSMTHYEFSPLETLKVRSSLNLRKKTIYIEKTKYKPGFLRQINNLIKIFNLKKTNKSINNLGKNKNFNIIPNIEEYLKLSLIIKKIYKNV